MYTVSSARAVKDVRAMLAQFGGEYSPISSIVDWESVQLRMRAAAHDCENVLIADDGGFQFTTDIGDGTVVLCTGNKNGRICVQRTLWNFSPPSECDEVWLELQLYDSHEFFEQCVRGLQHEFGDFRLWFELPEIEELLSSGTVVAPRSLVTHPVASALMYEWTAGRFDLRLWWVWNAQSLSVCVTVSSTNVPPELI